MSVLILTEHDNKQLKGATYHAVTAALQLHHDVDMLVIGWQCAAVAATAMNIVSVRKVLVADAVVYEHQLAENMAAVLALLGKNYTHIVATSSTFSKNILPRVAAILDVGMIGDVIEIVSSDTFVRPMFAGNVTVTIQSEDPIKVLTVRSTAFPVTGLQEDKGGKLECISEIIANEHTCFESQTLTPIERPELTAARIILAGGRGLKSSENFKRLEVLADQLGAAIGATRAAVDAGYAPNDYQVGQTGKVVAPDLYIAVGISGAIQHLAGMKDSKVIVAINNDPNAPIFQSADYILVGDLFKILPELAVALGE